MIDQTMDQPIPAGSATPKMSLINAIWRAFPSVSLGEVTEAADAILADLAAAGYRIVPADGFNAWYSPADIERLYRAVQDVAERTGKPFAWFQDAMDAALIAAASEPAGGDSNG